MRRAGGIDSAFLALEMHDHPLHVMAVMMLDPATVPGGYSFEGLRKFVADRLGGIPPFRQKLVPVPLGVGRPRGVGLNITVVSSAETIGFGSVTCPDVIAEIDALAAGVHSRAQISANGTYRTRTGIRLGPRTWPADQVTASGSLSSKSG